MMRSIQLKAMVFMVLVTTLSVGVIHASYRLWLTRSQEELLRDRLRRALLALGTAPEDRQLAFDELVLVCRRFDLSSGSLYNGRTGEVEVQIGFAVRAARFAIWQQHDWPGIVDIPSGLIPQETDADQHTWAIRRIARRDGCPYLLVGAVSRQHQILTSRRLDTLSIFMGSSGALLALGLSYLLRRAITRPADDLARAMGAVAREETAEPLDTRVDRELVPLVRSFNQMVDQLQQKRREVEEYQNHLEEHIQAIRVELEAREAELLETAKLASVGQLAAGVAHELNTPLQHILLTADLIRADLGDTESEERLDQLVAQARRCRIIIKDLLEHSRRHAARQERFALNPLVEEALESCRTLGLTKGVTLALDLAPQLEELLGTPEEIRRVVEVVLQNGLQAIGSKPADEQRWLRVCTAPAGEDVVCTIADNGPGMDAQTRQRALEPFFTTKDPGVGTGLGLSIAYAIVTKHNGALRLESEPGYGTTVRISLPTAAAVEAARAEGTGRLRKGDAPT